MATIFIDGKQYDVNEQENLLHVCLSAGLDLPYFCWHPALGSVGACRQCAVVQYKDENDTKGKLVMACMAPASDGTRIALADPQAAVFRASVIEWLMINHPHDCPICDEGGECHLQDMTVMTGHNYRRHRFKKRTYHNQYLGPLVNHEMNRCIQCYRCVRFYRDYAGGDDLDVFGAHDDVYFGRSEDGVLESPFSGNLVEVCPTGVFTDKTLKQHYTRKWDLQTAPSVCTLCSLGCNTSPGERYGTLRRIRNRYNHAVNGYFLCDRGRYGYEFVNSQKRIRQPLLRDEATGELTAVSPQTALDKLQELTAVPQTVIGIGSPRASLEANFALRQLVGAERFYSGVPTREAELVDTAVSILRNGPARSASLHDAEQADAVLILGEDVTNTAPRLALALRQAAHNQPRAQAQKLDIPLWNDAAVRELIQDEHGPFFSATTAATDLDELASATYRAAPDDLARLGFAVANLLDGSAPAVNGLSEEMQQLAKTIAEGLRGAERPLIVSGTSCGSTAVLQAAANIAWALSNPERPAGLSLVLPAANSFGLSLLGGQPLHEAAQALLDGQAEAVIILENDLTQETTPAFARALHDSAPTVVVLDELETATTAAADLVLPAATFAEGDGTLVNNEGRAQRFYQVFVPPHEAWESWRWLSQMGGKPGWLSLDEVSQALVEAEPQFAPILEIAPPADFRIHGERIPRQPHRYSGRTAINAHHTVHEQPPPLDRDAPLAFSMEGYQGQPPPELISHYWAPGWNSVQALNKFQDEVGGLLRGQDAAGNGRRLIEPGGGERPSYFQSVPDPFQVQDGQWLCVPLYHIFGSEPRSRETPGIAELVPEAYVAVGETAVTQLNLQEGQPVQLTLGETVLHLRCHIMPSLPEGVVGLPSGLPGIPALPLPAFVQLERRTEHE
ncbi:MAG: NADH-quinone oxidoreductase subunit NuoG [Anaerolineaceae bacterium]|nr:NADH-quinone oxidoreductase subunit NuoG [Anaerolineaceae bacterium]